MFQWAKPRGKAETEKRIRDFAGGGKRPCPRFRLLRCSRVRAPSLAYEVRPWLEDLEPDPPAARVPVRVAPGPVRPAMEPSAKFPTSRPGHVEKVLIPNRSGMPAKLVVWRRPCRPQSRNNSLVAAPVFRPANRREPWVSCGGALSRCLCPTGAGQRPRRAGYDFRRVSPDGGVGSVTVWPAFSILHLPSIASSSSLNPRARPEAAECIGFARANLPRPPYSSACG